jgi:hypothetical protein
MSNYYDFATNPQTYAPTNPNATPGWMPGAQAPPGQGPVTPQSAEAVLNQNDQSLSLGAERALKDYEKSDLATQRAEASIRAEEGLRQQTSRQMQPYYDQLQRANAQPLPAQPQQTPIPKAPTMQDAQKQDPNQAWLTAAMFLGVLGGALTRRPITNALSAFTGVVQGYTEAQNQNFEHAMKTWEAANKEALEKNAEAQKAYERILKSRDLSIEQKQLSLQIEAMRHQDQTMQQAAQTKDELTIATLYDKRAEMEQKFAQSSKQAVEEAYQQRARAQVQAHPEVVKAIGEYRQPLPTTLGRTGYQGAYITELRNAVLDAYPNYDATKFAGRQAAERVNATTDPRVAQRTAIDFSVGRGGQQAQSLNVAIDHLTVLDGLADALHNGQINEVNKLKNYLQTQAGMSAPTTFDAAKQVIGQEIIKAIVVNGGGVTERQEAARYVNAARSPEQLHNMVTMYQRLMAGQLHGLEQRYMSGTGRQDFEDKYLTPVTRDTLQKVFEGGIPANSNDFNDHINRLADSFQRGAMGAATGLVGRLDQPLAGVPSGTWTGNIPGYDRGRGLPAGWSINPSNPPPNQTGQ